MADGDARLLVTRTDAFPDLRFWIQGEATWPDQKLEVAAYGPSDLTRGKLAALWRSFEWSWVAYAAAAFFGLWAIMFSPLLIARTLRIAAGERRSSDRRSRIHHDWPRVESRDR